MNTKRVISFALVLCLLFGMAGVLTPAAQAKTITASVIQDKINAYYKAVSEVGVPHWNLEHDEDTLKKYAKDENFAASVRSKECGVRPSDGKHTGGKGISDYACDSNTFCGARQCHGFALYMCYIIFGSYPSKASGTPSNATSGKSGTWTLYKKDKYDFPGIQVGDMLRYYYTTEKSDPKTGKISKTVHQHSAIVYSVDNNETIYVIDCNRSSAENGKCRIFYNYKLGKSVSAFKKLYNAGNAYICRNNAAETPATDTSSTTASISLNKSSLTMKDNVCVALSATTTPSGQSVSWKSSNNSVVRVSNGNLEGVKAGNATITASMTYEGKTYTATCNVTVTPSQTICTTHKYTSSGGDYCTVCGYQYTAKKTPVDKTMYAAEDEVVVRSAPYAVSGNIVKTLKKNDAVKISYSITNSLDNKWYITSDGRYIYAERLTSTAPKKVCIKHTYTSTGGDICTVCGDPYIPQKSAVNKTMYAAEAEVVVRTSPYEHSSTIVKTLKKDDAVTISYSIDNALGNKWYITSDGYYIYAKRLTSTAPKKLCSKHTYTSSGGDYCTVCGYQYTPKKTTVDKTMYAAESEVVVRSAPYAVSSNIVKTIKKDDAVKISYSITNSLGNKWYITSDGRYIYAERLTTTAPKQKGCSKHTYTSSGGDKCTVCGYQYVPKKTTVDKTMYAIEKEVVVRTSPYEHSSTIVKTLKKGDAVKISYSIENSLGNKWYITSDGYYIYAKRLSTKKP